MKKTDWTGNKKSIWSTNGCSNHSQDERASLDYYATDVIAIDKLARKFDIPHKVWECACGGGHLSKRLKELGHDVFSTDVVDRGYEGMDAQADFLDDLFCPKPDGDYCILTNPPYSKSTEFILRALDILPVGGYAIFFLKTTALESKGRYERIFKNTPPKYVFQFVERILCAKNGNFEESRKNLGAGAQAYAWFVFEKGYNGKTTLDWLV